MEDSDDSIDGGDVGGSHEDGDCEATTQGFGSSGSLGKPTFNNHVHVHVTPE
jgi:hypothetical protein